jgi:hypothetical protein
VYSLSDTLSAVEAEVLDTPWAAANRSHFLPQVRLLIKLSRKKHANKKAQMN